MFLWISLLCREGQEPDRIDHRMPDKPSQDKIFAQPAGHCLAELNIATSVADVDNPAMAGFINALDVVNAIAERSPGFVWRLKDESGNAIGFKRAGDPREIYNLSVWERAQDLEFYIWKTVHRRFMNQRHRWFHPASAPYFVLWWVPQGERPTLDGALVRPKHLREQGPSAFAFGWANLVGKRLWQSDGAPPVG